MTTSIALHNDQSLLAYLQAHNLSYQLHEHPAVATCADASQLKIDISGASTKHLFLENKEGQLFALMTTHEKRVDLSAIKKITGSRVSFASAERLFETFGVTPGAVSLLGAINDKQKQVRLLADIDLEKYETLQQHPLRNTATIVLSKSHFISFFAFLERELEWVEVLAKG